MEQLRLFVALAIPEEVRSALGALQDRLRHTGAHVKWVRPSSIHLTLKFLGETEAGRVDEISLAMEEAAAGVEPFQLEAKGTGFFPNAARPRVCWVGLQGNRRALANVHERLEENLEAAGFPKEKRPFNAHLTLGRVRSPRNMNELIRSMTRHADDALGTIQVDRLILFRSQLNPKGAVYTRVREVALRES